MISINRLKNWWGASLSRRLLVASTGTLLLFLVVLGGLLFHIGRTSVHYEVTQRNDQLARLIARDISDHLNNAWNTLRLLAGRSIYTTRPLAFQARIMIEMRRAMPFTYRALYLFDEQGLQIHLADPLEALLALEDAADMIDRPAIPLPDEVVTAYEAAKSGEIYLSSAHLAGVDRVPVIYTAIPLDPGRSCLIVVAEIDLRNIWRQIDEVYVGQTGQAFVVSREGMIIAHPNRAYIGQALPSALAPVLVEYEGHAEYVDPVSRQAMLASYSPMGRQLGWGVVVEQARDQAFATVDALALTTLGVLLAATGIAACATALVARNIIRPIQDLATVTLEIAHTGDLDHAIAPRGQDEVGQLATAFAQMIAGLRQAREALAQERNLLRTLIDTLPDCIFVKDTAGRFLMVNAQGAQGRKAGSPDEVVGKTDFDFMAEDLAAKHQAQERAILQSGAPLVNHEEAIRTRSGEMRWFLTTKAPFTDGEGNIAGLVGISRDITDRKHAEEALLRRTNALQTLHDVVLDIGAEPEMSAVLSHIAESAVGLLGADRGAMIFLHEPDPDGGALRVIEAYGTGRTYIGAVVKSGEGIAGRVFQSGKPLAVTDYGHWAGRSSVYREDDAGAPKAMMGVPLLWRSATMGVLVLIADGRMRTFNQDDIWLAEMLGAKAALAIKNAQLYRELTVYSEDLERIVQARTVELRQTTERVEAILNNSPDALLLLGTDGAIETINPAVCEMFGYRQEEICARQPTVLVEDEVFDDALRAVLEQQQKKRLEITARRKDGTQFDADVAVAPIRENGAVAGLVCSLRDISALKEVERMKDAFVTNVSHQFRTPVTTIKLYTQLLQKQPERVEHYVQVLADQTERLDLLIQDVMEITRLSSGPEAAAAQVISPAAMIKNTVTRYQGRAHTAGLALAAEPSPPDLPAVRGDPSRLARLLSELVENALAFTPTGGRITLQARSTEAGGQTWALVIVEDTGPGIPPHEQAQVFERFYRGRLAEAGHIPGTGLGLAIAKEIATQHRGRIEVESAGAPGSGTRFTVWLPAWHEAAKPHTA